jgi:sortase A
MKLRGFRRTTVALLIVAMLAMAGTTGTEASESDMLRAEDHWQLSAPPSSTSESSPQIHDTYSLTYELPVQQASRSREDCPTAFSRFCDLFSSSDGEQIQDDEANERPRMHSAANQVTWSSGSISELAATARVEPTGLEVPSLGIEARVAGVGVDSDRKMEVPDDFNTVGWYRYGPTPGSAGNTVIAGHLDDARGRSVFFDLQNVEIGADVIVRLENGDAARFRVREKVSYDAGNLPSGEIFSREGDPALALITCSGTWDRSNGRYSETMIVYADPVA